MCDVQTVTKVYTKVTVIKVNTKVTVNSKVTVVSKVTIVSKITVVSKVTVVSKITVVSKVTVVSPLATYTNLDVQGHVTWSLCSLEAHTQLNHFFHPFHPDIMHKIMYRAHPNFLYREPGLEMRLCLVHLAILSFSSLLALHTCEVLTLLE